MIIFSSTFLGADHTFSPMPTKIDSISSMKISNGKFDEVYAGTDTFRETAFAIDTTWNDTTVMHASYEENLSAGNVSYTLSTTDNILIKRRRKGDLKWMTIYRKGIHTIEDFNISFIDLLAANGKTYEYAIVSVHEGISGAYNIVEAESQFDGMFLIGKDAVYKAALDIGECNTTRKHSMARYELPGLKYPKTCNSSNVNYDCGTAEGYFVRYTPVAHDFDIENSFDYRHDVMDFLSDNQPKLLKLYDGRMWLISIDGDPSDTANGHYLHRLISFDWFENGSCYKERDLYDAGLIDVPMDFWSESP